jgi:hypothetical protein
MSDYQYLKKYIPGGSGVNDNWFVPIHKEEILQVEKNMELSFPNQLREFYLEIGRGMIRSPHNPPADYDFYNSNEILPPLVVANFSKGILLWEGQEYWMAEDTYEMLEPGDLPFFEIGDSSRFLVMKTHSENPNAIWTDGIPLKIEDSFERFIWRLYYESPWFYDDIIEDYYKIK